MKKYCFVLLCTILCLVGCSTNERTQTSSISEETESASISDIAEEVELEEDPLQGMVRSPFTGLYVEETLARRRPMAIMINNLHKALPQSGIGQADIYYEALAEGEITRIEAIFQSFSGEKIGPVRSARDYFTYFALDHDAVYVHHGGSETGYSAIRNRSLDHFDGMHDTIAFWRDQERMNQPGMYEHSSYISSSGLEESWKNRGIRRELPENYNPMFDFYEQQTIPDGEEAEDICVPYSYYQISEFLYDLSTGLYRRIQSGQDQIDDITGKTLQVSNVIIQFANISIVDSVGRRAIDLVGSGEGLLFTGGKQKKVMWKKEAWNVPTQWTFEDGSPVILNPGKTWICVYSKDQADQVTTARKED